MQITVTGMTVGGRDWGVKRWKGVQTGDGYAVVMHLLKLKYA